MSRSLSARAGGITMTEGSLYKNIFLFSVPLIFSQLLQVLFNMADVAVVGKFSSATALGSVGSTSTLVTLFTGFLIGLSNGVNVRVAQYLGAKQEEDTRNCVHTSLILCALSGLVIAVLCFFLAAPMLELLRTKDDLLPGAVLYFRIYALGMPALGIFNFGNAVLSASGDTKRPLAYLTAAGILNVILNQNKEIIGAVAGDIDTAHKAGVAFLSSMCRRKPVFSDIVITSNGGYPLDQNIYQSVKGMTTAAASCKKGGVIIMLSSCCDGHGGQDFFQTFAREPDTKKILDGILSRAQTETIPDQWQSQIFCQILLDHTVILVSDAPREMVEALHLIYSNSLSDAFCQAVEILHKPEPSITLIPDGVSVILT